MQYTIITSLLAAPLFALAQFPPPVEYSNILKSPINENITVAYKTPPAGTCTTAFSTQKQFTGYIVIQMADGSYGTQARMWGWDRSSNVLFIDQPTQVGLSYDSLTNLTYDLFEDQYLPYDFQNDTSGNTRPAYALMNGTFSSGDPEFTTNTTDISARAAWHFLQSFLAAFPQYNPGVRPNSSHVSTTGVNLFAESYGGTYGPTFANYFEEQNAKRENGTLPKNSTLEIKLTSLGIVNGLIDSLIQDYYYATFAYNNTFGIQTISQTDELNLIEQYNNQCSRQTNLCRAIANGTDPEGEGDSARANVACQAATYYCNSLMNPFQKSNLSVYDIRVKNPSPDPSNAYLEYLNTASVQEAIGARVNYTTSSSAVMNAFVMTGDSIRGGQIQEIANLLRAGVRVSLMYGDADYIAASFAVAAALSDFPSNGSTPSYLAGWNSAGYADIVVNTSYVGGAVRQFGNFSFSRIYDAGHMVPFYQPETAFTIFTRIIDGTELSTGEPIDLSDFKSSGPMNSTHMNSPLAKQPAPTCWIRAMQDTCSAEQIEDMQEGKGIVAGGIWYSNSKQYSAPSSTVTAGKPGTPVTSSSTSSRSTSGSTTSTVALTGVFTATATPSPTQGAASGAHDAMHEWIQNATQHANHIFNAVHSSLRQFGSSLNHNGMSLFIATVPEGTEFYHGTEKSERVEGMQWLAFEPEHALIFARGRRGPPPGDGHGPPADGRGPPADEEGDETAEGTSSQSELESEDKEKHHIPEGRPRHRGGKDGKSRIGKPHGDNGCHGPSRNDSRPDGPHHGPPPPPPHRGPPGHHHDDTPRRCPPGEGHLPSSWTTPDWFKHHDENHDENHDEDHDDRDHPEHHGSPPHEGFDGLSGPHHDHPDHHDFPILPIGYWVHRLGDLMRNPKRRHVPPPKDISSKPMQSEMIETRAEQEPLAPGNPGDNNSGYLHTYRTKHNLRLLYVDGQSAAKSKKGTLDTQDVLLLENSIDNDSGMFGERERAEQLCKLVHEQWDDSIDGILRMEGGFEIILCDFAAHLDVVSIAKTNPKAGGGFGGGADNGDGFNYYRAVAARYHGVGGGRAVLDYEGFVSAFAYPEAVTFDSTGRPRLNNESSAMDSVRQAVDKMILQEEERTDSVNWQAITDMVVARYADRIEYLASGSLTTLSTLKAEIERALRPFIDYSARNSSSEIERCASQFIPGHVSSTSTIVAAQAIRQVTRTLCSSLMIASEQTDYTTAFDQIKQLKEYLAWTTWKQCRGCAADEICFLPIWPVGTAEDFEQPKCRSDVSLAPGNGGGDRYWNDLGGPGGKGPGPQKRRKKNI
ncbi:unnamed protein product [Aureobasidium uvarum]|uniref:Carboxypeptidase n=1 Tax=Aureobasidium uvarum TaxID=2773716 RepID=A0A9N8KGC6_9PEZI|nr:unnamed protein product [Aureobasidium uvarum]